MSNKPMSAFGRAPIKMEGGVSNPDEWTFQCHCGECQELRKKWLAHYEGYREGYWVATGDTKYSTDPAKLKEQT